MGKIIDDTLKIRGKYSMDRILVAVSFPITLAIGIYIVISDRLLGLKTVNGFAIQVFTGLLGFIVAIVITKQYGKIKEQVLEPNLNTSQEEKTTE